MDEKEYRIKLEKNIMNEFLGSNYMALSYLRKKIKDSHVNAMDLFTLYEIHKVSFEKVKSFSNHVAKINYIFKILEHESGLL